MFWGRGNFKEYLLWIGISSFHLFVISCDCFLRGLRKPRSIGFTDNLTLPVGSNCDKSSIICLSSIKFISCSLSPEWDSGWLTAYKIHSIKEIEKDTINRRLKYKTIKNLPPLKFIHCQAG